MKHTLLSTLALGALALGLAAPAAAQLDRTSGDDKDVIWARDIGSATITLDGNLNEPEWAQAETITLKWDDPLGFPGSGQWFDINNGNPFGLEDPVDPIDATVSFLRKGNDLYIAVNAKDQSIGGGGLWDVDGLLMTVIDKNNRAEDFSDINNYFGSTREELAFSWWNRGRGQDTTATGEPLPGLPAFFYSQTLGSQYAHPDSTGIDRDGADFGFTIDGVSNDDFNGNANLTPDTGYTLEFVFPVDSLGWDLTQPMARMPLSVAIQDSDYNWPRDETRFSTTRSWWQGQWLNTLSQGVGYVAADPSVTVSSGEAPAYTMPEFRVPSAANVDAPTVDGKLDEEVWDRVDPQFSLKYKATPEELDAGLPGVLAPYYSFYFHPDANPVLEPSEGNIEMFYKDTKLYIGLDADDDAVNGIEGESGRDGFRLIIRSRDSTQSSLQAEHLRFDFSVDSTGAARINNVPDEVEVGTDLIAAVSLKDGSTAGDASDIDSGYQMEVMLDLAAIGYDDVSDGASIWVSINYFDGDALLDDALSYSTRTWSMGERVNGASIMGYLDPNADLSVSSEGGASEGLFRSLGSAPNPSSGLTRLRYELPTSADVTVEVFDVLGRLVQTVEAGPQPEGRQSVEIDGASLGAGTYLYRVSMEGGESVTGRLTIVR